MCGRLNVTSDPLSKMVSDALGVPFDTTSNDDLRPSEQVATLQSTAAGVRQGNVRWGIQPSWAKRLIINAQAESVAEKPTFKRAFQLHRCVIPCSGWYEWQAKAKYLFQAPDQAPLYMAGIYYDASANDETPRLVTLTTKADEQCIVYHHRMPLLVQETQVRDWLSLPWQEVIPLLQPSTQALEIKRCA